MHRLSFMGVCPPEEFRCRIYYSEPLPDMTRDEAIAWLVAEATKYGKEGTEYHHSDEWNALVEELCESEVIHLYHGKVFLGPDFKRPGER